MSGQRFVGWAPRAHQAAAPDQSLVDSGLPNLRSHTLVLVGDDLASLPGTKRGQVRAYSDASAVLFTLRRPPLPHGFTLIELLAAITLLALLATILMGTVRGAERSVSAATDLVERTEQYARTQSFLREHIAGALPLRWRKEPGQPLKFDGKADSITYLAPVTSQIAEGGVMWWQLTVARSNGAVPRSQLVLRRVAQDPDDKAVPDVPATDTVVLADGIDAVKLAYFDVGPDPLTEPDTGTWVDSWSENSRMPSMVSIRVTEQGGREWPELLVPLRLTQALGCNFDFQKQRCILPGVVTR